MERKGKKENYTIVISNQELKESVQDLVFEYMQFLEVQKPLVISDQKLEFEPTQILIIPSGGLEGILDGVSILKVNTGNFHDDLEMALHWFVLQERSHSQTAFSPKMVRQRYVSLLTPMIVLMEVEDEKGYSHSQRVTRLFVRFCRFLGLSKEMEPLYQAYGMLHDIGKIGLEQLMLYSPTRLRSFEETGEDHTIAGSVFIATLEVMNDFLPFVRSHHEHFDGRGYPDRIAGDEIPFWVRVLAVVDWYDDVLNTVDTEYSSGLLSSTEALKQIQKHGGSRFDPEIAKLFVRFMLLESNS